jgi:hypothetical protein
MRTSARARALGAYRSTSGAPQRFVRTISASAPLPSQEILVDRPRRRDAPRRRVMFCNDSTRHGQKKDVREDVVPLNASILDSARLVRARGYKPSVRRGSSAPRSGSPCRRLSLEASPARTCHVAVRSGQSFRNRSGQRSRNPQRSLVHFVAKVAYRKRTIAGENQGVSHAGLVPTGASKSRAAENANVRRDNTLPDVFHLSTSRGVRLNTSASAARPADAMLLRGVSCGTAGAAQLTEEERLCVRQVGQFEFSPTRT